MLTETWLNSSVYSSEIFDGRYAVFRRDRCNESKMRGEGVLSVVRRVMLGGIGKSENSE